MTLRTLAGLLLVLAARTAGAAELQIQYTAIQKLLAQEVFSEDGKRYLSGSPKTKCNFAYLENPEVHGEDGRLTLRAMFSGRSALDLLGRCIGMGDSFEVDMTAVPYYHDNVIGLKEVKVETPAHKGYYVRRVCASLADSLRKQFQYHVADEAKKILETQRDQVTYRQQLIEFSVPDIKVTQDALVVTFEFSLIVK